MLTFVPEAAAYTVAMLVLPLVSHSHATGGDLPPGESVQVYTRWDGWTDRWTFYRHSTG